MQGGGGVVTGEKWQGKAGGRDLGGGETGRAGRARRCLWRWQCPAATCEPGLLLWAVSFSGSDSVCLQPSPHPCSTQTSYSNMDTPSTCWAWHTPPRPLCLPKLWQGIGGEGCAVLVLSSLFTGKVQPTLTPSHSSRLRLYLVGSSFCQCLFHS